MKTLALLLVLGAGCFNNEQEIGPVIPQGGAPTTTSVPGAPSTISGRVCVLDDLQNPTICRTASGANLTVTLGSSSTTSATDGSFTVSVPAGLTNVNNPTFSVTGPGIVPTAFPFTLPFTGTGTVPVVDADLFARALSSNGVPLTIATTCSILATVRDANGPAVGVTATTIPESLFGPFFDSPTSTNWGVDGTGMRGVVLIPGLTVGMVDLSFSHIAGGLETNVAGIAVRNGGVTILDTSLQTSP